MRAQFESFGIYLPEKIVTSEDLLTQMKNKPQFDLKRITGIKSRRYRSKEEDSLSLAIAAAKDCLNNSKYNASDLDIIIRTSISRLRGGSRKLVFEPPLSLMIKKEL